MATKKAASKQAAETPGTPAKAAAKTAVKKSAAKKAPAKAAEPTPSTAHQATETTTKHKPTHHDISVQAYLLWERDGKKHGHHDKHWQQAEHELNK